MIQQLKLYLCCTLIIFSFISKAQPYIPQDPQIDGPRFIYTNSTIYYTSWSGSFSVNDYWYIEPQHSSVIPTLINHSPNNVELHTNNQFGYFELVHKEPISNTYPYTGGQEDRITIYVVGGIIGSGGDISTYNSEDFQTITKNCIPEPLNINTLAGVTSIQWLSATIGVGVNVTPQTVFTPIIGATSLSYQPTVSSLTTAYKCELHFGAVIAYSAYYVVEVLDPLALKGGGISLNGNCMYNNKPDIRASDAISGNFCVCTYTYEWQYSYDNQNWFIYSNSNLVGFPTGAINNLMQTTFIRRKVTCGSETAYSNTLPLIPVYNTVCWENLNYVRENIVLIPNIKYWQDADMLPIGDKLQTTTYLDGIGRPIEKVSKQTATPPPGSAPATLWGDVVQVVDYDAYGRQSTQYLPYTTTTNSGLYKNKTITYNEQINYYFAKQGEGLWAKSTVEYDNSPLNRVINQKSPGQSWQSSVGNTAGYELNDLADNVQMLAVDNLPSGGTPYSMGSLPYCTGVYPRNALYRSKYVDVNNKQVIEYRNNIGQLILKKVQLDDAPTTPVEGWICTYSIYDDYGRLRYQLQPEAVKEMEKTKDATGKWVFNYSELSPVDLNTLIFEQFFVYNYDEKGRNVYKKAPGAKPLYLIYDNRDRVVFMQDGNQRSLTPLPQWTANVYDDLDRPTITTLYNTNKIITQLQADIQNAVTITTVTTTTPGIAINNLVLSNRATQNPAGTPAKYKAQQSIELVSNAGGSFESNTGDEFVAEIDGTATSPSTIVTTTTYNNPVPLTSADVTVLKYVFYDKYNFPDVRPFNTNFKNTVAYPTSATVLPIASTQRTLSYSTGEKVRVLGTNKFITTTHYFNEDGASIQAIEDNLLDGQDVTTVQYGWDGRLLSTHTIHSTLQTGIRSYEVLSKHLFDKIGRTTALQKKYGAATAFKTITTYAYDDMGRLQTKILDPDYVNTTTGKSGLETLDYTYNIHNQITGINKDYALKKASTYQKWSNYFGLYLGFDNKDNVFATPNLAGQVAGLLWNTQGDDAQRKYDYTYDNAGRLIKADFTQKDFNENSYINTNVDFSVLGHGNKNGKTNTIEYDLNGNLLTMIQKGVQIGNNSPITVDDLQYTYKQYSNKLESVTDVMTTAAANGTFGDFKDGANNATTPDYVYDENGNIVIDLNKNVKDIGGVVGNGIKYNFLDKPEEINIAGKGTIKLVYSADGEKLRKIYQAANQSKAKYTTYINQFIYEEVVNTTNNTLPVLGGGAAPQLSYINFEEGRIRILQPTNTGNSFDMVQINGSPNMPIAQQGFVGEGVFDYYIRDYQENVRMILTEENHYTHATSTLEDTRDNNEQPIFGTPTKFNVNQIPGQSINDGWNNPNIGAKVSQLSKLAQQVGPNSLLKVMAGDQILAQVDYYYKNLTTNTTGSNLAQTVLTNLVTAIGSSNVVGSAIKTGATNIGNSNTGKIDGIAAPHSSNSTTTTPKAYLTVLFFDERFNFIPNATLNIDEGSRFTQVRASDAGNHNPAPLILDNGGMGDGIKAPKNGYAFVYVSNESNEFVYFDNLKISHTRSRIIEENHYYSYGLKITGISSSKLGDALDGTLANKNLYNDKEMIDEADLNWYDYGFRNYDPQIGRFTQLDPLTFDYEFLTPYQYASCEPIANIDEDGLEAYGVLGGIGEAGEIGSVFTKGYNAFKEMIKILTIGEEAFSCGATIAKVSATVSTTAKTLKTLVTVWNTVKTAANVLIDFLKVQLNQQPLPQISNSPTSSTERKMLDKIYDHEGREFEIVSGDRGGATKFGIDWPTWKLTAKPILNTEPTQPNLKKLDVNGADKIYKVHYFKPLRIGEIKNARTAMAIFDQSALGENRVKKNVKKVLNDMGYKFKENSNKFSDAEIEALNKVDQTEFVKKFKDIQIKSYEKIVERDASQGKFLKGWKNRVNSL